MTPKQESNFNNIISIYNPPKNFATKFFNSVSIKYDHIDPTKVQQVSSLIKQNIDVISKNLFNAVNNGKNIFVEKSNAEVYNSLGKESISLIQSHYTKLTKSVSEVCLLIKHDELNPQEILDVMGITYHHGNLPGECDGLF